MKKRPTYHVNRPVTDSQILQEYVLLRDVYLKLTGRVEERCRRIASEYALRGNFQSRTKEKDRVAAKLSKLREKLKEGPPSTRRAWLREFSDLSGVRVLAYDESSRLEFVRVLTEEFKDSTGSVPTVDEKDKVDAKQANFYRSTHLEVTWPADLCIGDDENLMGLVCEIQVTSLLAHVWNEIEHDLAYKQLQGAPSEPEKNLLRILGNLVLAGDIAISELLLATETRQKDANEPFVDEHDFVARLRKGLEPRNIARGRVGQLFEVCSKLGLNSPKKVLNLLGKHDFDDIEAGILAFNERLYSDEESLTLDSTTSDYLAYVLAKSRREDILKHFPTGRGLGAPLRIVRIVKRMES